MPVKPAWNFVPSAGQADVARAGEPEAVSDRRALDRGQDGSWAPVEAQQSLVDGVRVRQVAAGEGLEITAGAEDRALAGDDHRPHPGVLLDLLDRQHQPVGDRIAQRVAGLRPGQGHPRDPVSKLVGDALGHQHVWHITAVLGGLSGSPRWGRPWR